MHPSRRFRASVARASRRLGSGPRSSGRIGRPMDATQLVVPAGTFAARDSLRRRPASRTQGPGPSPRRSAPAAVPLAFGSPVPSRSSRQSEQIPQVVTTASPDRTRLSQASSRPHQAQTRRKIAGRFSPVVRAVTLCRSVGCCPVRGSSSRMGGVLALLAMTRGYAGGAGEILRVFSAFCQYFRRSAEERGQSPAAGRGSLPRPGRLSISSAA